MSDVSTERRRKRVRKGTKSCWECKRRKIRCDFAENEQVCVGCLDRGKNCLSQEYADEAQLPTGSQLGQQIGRVETLLEKLMAKVDSNNTTVGRALCASRESLGIDVLTPSSTPSSQYEGAPVLSLFENGVFGREPHSGLSGQNRGVIFASIVPSSPRHNSALSQNPSKLEILRRELLAILPSQHDVDVLWTESYGWRMIRRHILPQLDKFPDSEFAKPFTIHGVSQAHPIVITRLLLSIALSIQQLPPTYDSSRLHLRGFSKHHVDQYMDAAAHITSDDELIGSLEGIECLTLQGIFHINLGNIRRAWLCFRRAINVAQLMGLHRPSLPSNGPTDSTLSRRRHYLWFQLVKGDRFLSLILGVPSSGGHNFPFDDIEEWLSVEDMYNKNLCHITGLIIDRNQGESTHAFSNTQNIDERLDKLAKEMPSSWWDVPTSQPPSQSEEAAQQLDRVITQLWHFQLETLVHLPFMLRAATDRRYEYSRLSCLAASRGLVLRWMFALERASVPLICRVYQFMGFTAAVILLLGILQPAQGAKSLEQLQEEEEDRKMVNLVKQSFIDMQKVHVDSALSQSVDAMNLLESVISDENRGGNLRLNIPYFGTISVSHDGSSSRNHYQPSQPVLQRQENSNHQVEVDLCNPQNIPFTQPPNTTPPMFSFTSSHLPTLTPEAVDWEFSDSDTILFDALINTDLGGNWNF